MCVLKKMFLRPLVEDAYAHAAQLYGEEFFGTYEQFAQTYIERYLAPALGIPVAHEITFNVRYNPSSSALTKMLVDVNAPTWYT